jgi:hypothetical protein
VAVRLEPGVRQLTRANLKLQFPRRAIGIVGDLRRPILPACTHATTGLAAKPRVPRAA